MAPQGVPQWCTGWWAQIDGDLKLPGMPRTASAKSLGMSRTSSSKSLSRSPRCRNRLPRNGDNKSTYAEEAVLVPRPKKSQKLTAAHEVSGKLALLKQEVYDPQAPASGRSGSRRPLSKPSSRGALPRSPHDSHEQLPAMEVPLPVIVVAPTSLTITSESGNERVMKNTWIVLDSITTIEAALNCLHEDAGGGTISEGGERLQQVSDDRLNAKGAEANFQRCSHGASLIGLRHAVLILRLCGNRERRVDGVQGSMPSSAPPSIAEINERARRVESIVAFRAATASQRTRPESSQVTPRSPRLPAIQTSSILPRQSMMQKGLQALEEFNRFAAHKFGNTVRAWFMLDPEGKMAIGEKQFARACDEIGFRGNLVALWRYLDSDQSGYITILELDAQSAISLAEFKTVIRDRFGGSAMNAFNFMDDNHSDRLFKDEFVGSMKKLGFKARTAARLFSMFDCHRLGSITSKDVVFLDRWNPPPYLFSRPDVVGLENFKNILRSHFTSLLRSWRQLLDRDGTMRVSWDEFCDTCKHLQKKGHQPGVPKTENQRAGVWRSLDEDCGGWISLREFDQDAFDCLAKFKHWAVKNHGAVATGVQHMVGASGKLTDVELDKIDEFNSKLLIQGLNLSNNVTVVHTIDEHGRKVTVETPFLTEKDVRFLDKWDLDWEEQEYRAKRSEAADNG